MCCFWLLIEWRKKPKGKVGQVGTGPSDMAALIWIFSGTVRENENQLAPRPPPTFGISHKLMSFDLICGFSVSPWRKSCNFGIHGNADRFWQVESTTTTNTDTVDYYQNWKVKWHTYTAMKFYFTETRQNEIKSIKNQNRRRYREDEEVNNPPCIQKKG